MDWWNWIFSVFFSFLTQVASLQTLALVHHTFHADQQAIGHLRKEASIEGASMALSHRFEVPRGKGFPLFYAPWFLRGGFFHVCALRSSLALEISEIWSGQCKIFVGKRKRETAKTQLPLGLQNQQNCEATKHTCCKGASRQLSVCWIMETLKKCLKNQKKD